MNEIKVALLQQSYKGSHKATLEHSLALITQACASGAKLVVLPELHTREYFCQSEDPKFFDYAESFSEEYKTLSEISKNLNIVLITSLFEKRTQGMYHNSAFVFDSGELVGKYRKMHIPDDPNFYEKFYFTPGDLGFKPINTSLGRLGVLICWDQWYPEAARLMTLRGAEILIYPTAIGWFRGDSKLEKERQLEAWVAVQRGHSIANGLPVCAVNRVGFEADSSGVSDGILFWGNSFAFGSQGESLIPRGSSVSEEILFFIWDKKRVEEVRRMWPFLRDRRIECYKDLTKRFIDE